MEEIIVEKKENSILVCVLENNKIVEKYSFTNKSNSTIGNIYIGTVRDIFNGMQAAFVDIGLEKNAFLSLKDAVDKVNMVKECGQESDFVKAGSESKNCLKKSEVKLSKILKKGQNILVQVRKESFEDKGARISTHITWRVII